MRHASAIGGRKPALERNEENSSVYEVTDKVRVLSAVKEPKKEVSQESGGL